MVGNCNRAACGLRTDWLRRVKVMKTAGKENQTRCPNEAAPRDRRTEGQNNPAQWGGLEAKKISSRRRSVFFLDSFYRTNQELKDSSIDRAHPLPYFQ
jgi:hypothetical protein